MSFSMDEISTWKSYMVTIDKGGRKCTGKFSTWLPFGSKLGLMEWGGGLNVDLGRQPMTPSKTHTKYYFQITPFTSIILVHYDFDITLVTVCLLPCLYLNPHH